MDVFPCTMPATTANLKSSSTFFPRVRTSTQRTSTASPPYSPPSGKATPLVSSSSLKRARPSQELPLTDLHTWRRRRRRRSKPCSDNPESAKTCDIIGQNTVLLYTTTTKLDFFLDVRI